jgi:hypothetical protein
MTGVLLIDADVKARAKALTEYAEKNPYSIDDILDVANGATVPPGDQPEYTMNIERGYKVVFTIDKYPFGIVRHFSMSTSRPGMLPSPEAVDVILPLFGFTKSCRECHVTLEGPEDNPIAIAVYEFPASLSQDDISV